MRGHKTCVFLRALLVALAIAAIITTPVLADPAGKLIGVATGLMLAPDPEANMLWRDIHYIWNIHQTDDACEVGDACPAKGDTLTTIRFSPTELAQIQIEFDCVKFFLTDDGRSAAYYSGTVVKSKYPDWYTAVTGSYEGQLKIGMVIDGGPGGVDEAYFWVPPPGITFFPDEGVPLGCVVPEGAIMIPFVLTGGDVEVRMP